MPQSVTNCNGFKYQKWTKADSPEKSGFVRRIVTGQHKNGRPITGLPYAPEGAYEIK